MGLVFNEVTLTIDSGSDSQQVSCDFVSTAQIIDAQVALQGWDLSFAEDNYDILRFIVQISDFVFDKDTQNATCSLVVNVADAGAHYMEGTVNLVFVGITVW